MHEGRLLNLDPDVLFQQHSIAEVGDIQRELLHEIERKKEEIRMMVGERYRDFIEAADTIADMRTTAQHCIQNIEDMILTCTSIHNSHLIGFKNEILPTINERPVLSKGAHGVAVQIKVLMSIPEQIWASIDREDFLNATQLYLFSRHIYTGLQLEIGGNTTDETVTKLMPVVHRQWTMLSSINEYLVNACLNKLSNADIKAEVAASCLASYHLLGKSIDMLDSMNTFITMHSTNSLSKTLNNDIQHCLMHGNIKYDVKERITVCVKVIVKTLELIYSCFVENNEGLIIQYLKKLYDKDSPPLITQVKFDNSVSLKLLPKVISEYRLTSLMPLQPVTKAELSHCVSNWMKWVQTFTAERVELLLSYMNSAKSLHSIRESAMFIETPSNWTEICVALSIEHPESDVWTTHFQPLVTKRLQDIISSRWSEIEHNLHVDINDLLKNVTKPNSKEAEVDLNWFVWNDLIAQSYVSSDDDIINSVNALMKGLSMQDRGFTPNLEKVCEKLDQNLYALLEDLRIYLYGSEKSSTPTYVLVEDEFKLVVPEKKTFKDLSMNKKYLDRLEIEDYLRSCSLMHINRIIDYINTELIKESDSENLPSDLYYKTAPILASRFLQAVPLLVLNLRNCFIPVHYQLAYDDYQGSDPSVIASWEDVCKILTENCNSCWLYWIRDAQNRIDSLLNILPQEFTFAANVDYLLVQWDAIAIEEKDDQDQPVTSTIKIPSGPSIKLQQFLYSVSCILNEVIPHTLPKEIHIRFIEMVADKVLKHFLTVIKAKNEEINQKCALQLLTDVRHTTLLLVARENKNSLADSHEICDLLKEKIDPFDYDVFYPKLQINVKRSVQRVQTLLGCLIPNYDQLISIIGNKPLTSGGTADRDPNAFILPAQGSTSNTWFSLLPVTAPLPSNKKQTEKQRKKNKRTSSPANAQISSQEISTMSSSGTSNIMRSSAAAFFGSMTSDWFGNSTS